MNRGMDIDSLREEVVKVSKILEDRYSDILDIDREDFRKTIKEKTGELLTLKNLDENEIKNFKNLVAIDGSYNKMGGNFPHYIELYRALALRFDKSSVSLNEVFSPLTGNYKESDENMKKRLAEIEVNCAMKAIRELRPKYIMMDGGLLRYRIYAKEALEALLKMADETDTILFGVIKDIKTDYIRTSMELDDFYYDRELLYGILNRNEAIFIRESINKKFEYNIRSCLLRTSSFPLAIGIDVYNRNRDVLYDVASFVCTITPENSRGVPYFLDIVDSEVKITNKMMEGILKDNLRRDYYERFFVSERDKRSMK